MGEARQIGSRQSEKLEKEMEGGVLRISKDRIVPAMRKSRSMSAPSLLEFSSPELEHRVEKGGGMIGNSNRVRATMKSSLRGVAWEGGRSQGRPPKKLWTEGSKHSPTLTRFSVKTYQAARQSRRRPPRHKRKSHRRNTPRTKGMEEKSNRQRERSPFPIPTRSRAIFFEWQNHRSG